MGRIAVFDSGLGSLSIIRPVQNAVSADIIYFADRKSFPYGAKTRAQLAGIIGKTIDGLEAAFSPDVIVMASNTPSIMLDVDNPKVVGVLPPIRESLRLTESGNVGILATRASVRSRELRRHIREQAGAGRIHRIDGSDLVDMVESGRFLVEPERCRDAIRECLADVVAKRHIDVVTLSSTHLVFLRRMLEGMFPDVQFIDPGISVAAEVAERVGGRPGPGTLRIYSSMDPAGLEERLAGMGIRGRVSLLSF